MTVQDLLNKSVAFIDDTENISTYGTERLPLVSKIIYDLMREKIGINSQFLRYEIGTTAPAYTVEGYIPIVVPVTTEDQIVNVQLDGYSLKMYTETVDNVFYILVPETANIVTVEYMAAASDFTALTDTLPINDAAVTSVASVGLAALLSVSECPEKTNYLEGKYMEAQRDWKKRNINKLRKIRGYYEVT